MSDLPLLDDAGKPLFEIKYYDDGYGEHVDGLLRIEGDMIVLDVEDPDNPGIQLMLTREEVFVVGCASCGEDGPELDECPRSQRPCGHHCNHSWEHGECDWCETTFEEKPF
jgi:hypothetical protein